MTHVGKPRTDEEIAHLARIAEVHTLLGHELGDVFDSPHTPMWDAINDWADAAMGLTDIESDAVSEALEYMTALRLYRAGNMDARLKGYIQYGEPVYDPDGPSISYRPVELKNKPMVEGRPKKPSVHHRPLLTDAEKAARDKVVAERAAVEATIVHYLDEELRDQKRANRRIRDEPVDEEWVACHYVVEQYDGSRLRTTRDLSAVDCRHCIDFLRLKGVAV